MKWFGRQKYSVVVTCECVFEGVKARSPDEAVYLVTANLERFGRGEPDRIVNVRNVHVLVEK